MDRYLAQIAVADQLCRLNGLLMALREEEIPFTLKRQRIGEHWTENVHVEIIPGKPKVVIGAHHDSVKGSTGANDNASGVCVLLKLAKTLLQFPPTMPLELVFFDREEGVDRGSEAYIRYTGRDNIRAMINLDICGYGDTIAVAPLRNLQTGLLAKALNQLDQKEHCFCVVEHLPPGDDVTFEQYGVPNITLCVLPEAEVDIVARFGEYIYRNSYEAMEALPLPPSIMETMHNGPRDSIEVVQKDSMQLLHRFVAALVSKIRVDASSL